MTISMPRYTVDDLDRFPDDGNRYELLDGYLIVTSAPSTAHQIVAVGSKAVLFEALARPGFAHVVGSGAVERRPRTQLQPDMLVFPTRFAPTTHWRKINEH